MNVFASADKILTGFVKMILVGCEHAVFIIIDTYPNGSKKLETKTRAIRIEYVVLRQVRGKGALRTREMVGVVHISFDKW